MIVKNKIKYGWFKSKQFIKQLMVMELKIMLYRSKN